MKCHVSLCGEWWKGRGGKKEENEAFFFFPFCMQIKVYNGQHMGVPSTGKALLKEPEGAMSEGPVKLN